jgi:RNA polymerase sigma factor (sigma-70 family)
MKYQGDQYCIEQILSGNINPFTDLVNRHKDHSFNLAFRICGNREEAEEIIQDSFLKAFRSLNQFKMKSSFATWLYRIVYNTSISLVRARKQAPLSLDEFPVDLADFMILNPEDDEALKEYRSALVNFALQKLKEDKRALISLHYYEELPVDEIAEITGLGKSNIKVRLFRARQKMIEIIEKAEKKNIVCYE